MPETPQPPSDFQKKKGLVRRFYDWCVVNSRHPHAQWLLFGVAFAESSFFIFPPDIFMTIMVLGHRERWIRYATIALVGSVLGGLFGYLIGFGFWEVVKGWFLTYVFSEEVFRKAQQLYIDYDFWIIFTAAFTPIPYKVFTITGGVMQLNLVNFTLASIIGRGGRFFIISYLLFLFGPPIRNFIEKYFSYITIIFTALLLGGFVFLKFIAGH